MRLWWWGNATARGGRAHLALGLVDNGAQWLQLKFLGLELLLQLVRLAL